MKGLRAAFGVFRDLWMNFFGYCGASFAWWLSVFTIVLGPPATVTLMALTDPRRETAIDPATLRDAPRLVRENFRTSWKIGIFIIPIIVLSLFNSTFYTSGRGAGTAFGVVWVVLTVVGSLVILGIFASIALYGDGAKEATRRSLEAAMRRPADVLTVGLLAWLVTMLSLLMVLPIFLLLPSLLAGIANRWILFETDAAVPSPNEPTPERAAEKRTDRSWRGKVPWL